MPALRTTIMLTIGGLLVVPNWAHAQDALGDGHALDGNLSTRGTRNNMTSRSRNDETRFSLGRNPLAGRGYQNAVGYRSNEDFRNANAELTMYADSLYNNPWYWENLGNLSTELVTSGGSGGLGRAAANGGGGGYYNPFFFNADASNAGRFQFGRRISDFGRPEDGLDRKRSISPVDYDDLQVHDDNRPLVYSIGEPNRFLRDDRRSSVLRSSYELRDLNTQPDYVGVGMMPGDIPVRYAASSLQGIYPARHDISASDLGLTQYDEARLLQDERNGMTAMPGVPWRPDFDYLSSINNRVDPGADGSRLENRTNTTLDDLLLEIADRYKAEQGTASAADLAMLQEDYRNVLHEVVDGYGMREAGMGQMPGNIAGIPGSDSSTTPGGNRFMTMDDESDTEAGSSTDGGELEPADATDTRMPLEKFGLVLRHGQQVDALAEDDQSRLSELILAGQDKLADGEYYWAEKRFNRALRFVPGHPLATAGLGHAQLGGGLYLTSALTLQSLLGFQPEMIDVIYDDALLPKASDLDRVISDLNMRLQEGEDKSRYAFLLAYIGHQIDNERMVKQGLGEMRKAEGDEAYIRLLESVWMPESGTPKLKTEPEAPAELIPLKPVEAEPSNDDAAAPVEMSPGVPAAPDMPEPGNTDATKSTTPAPPPVDLDDLE